VRAHPLVEGLADIGGMHFKGAVAEDIERYAFVVPPCQLFCPFLEERFVDFHVGIADIAQEDKVSRCYNMHRQVWLAFAGLEYSLLFIGSHSNRARIHHHPRNLMLPQ